MSLCQQLQADKSLLSMCFVYEQVLVQQSTYLHKAIQ